MFIVDAQVHLSGPDGKPRRGQISGGVFAEEVLQEMDKAGVTRAVLAGTSFDPHSNQQCLDAAIKYPDRFAVFSGINLKDPDIREKIRNWKQTPGLYGLRANTRKLATDAPDSLKPDHWLWSALEDAQIPTMVRAADHIECLKPIVDRHPGLKLSLCHMAANTYGRKDEAVFDHLPVLLELAKHPNVTLKATGLPTYSTEAYPFPRLHEPLRKLYEAYGASRMFWGTDLTRATYWDLPGRPRKATYRQAVAMFTEELPWLKEKDKELTMGRAICDWIGWPVRPQ